MANRNHQPKDPFGTRTPRIGPKTLLNENEIKKVHYASTTPKQNHGANIPLPL